MSFWTALKNIWSNDIRPFVITVVKSEVRALAPIAQAAVTNLTINETAALAAGGSDTGHVLAAVVRDTVNQAQAAGINAASSSILTAVGNAVNKVK